MVPSTHEPRAARFASLRTVKEAHRLHAEGATVKDAAIATIHLTRYDCVHGYCQTLRSCWAALGLPVRSRSAAQIRRARTESPGTRPGGRSNYRHDIRTEDLVTAYRETLSTPVVAARFGCTQFLVWGRLKPLGEIVPIGDARRATIDRP